MTAKLKIIIAMLTWGSLGMFVRHIHLSAGEIALFRGIIGFLFLIGISFLMKTPFSKRDFNKNRWILLASGIVLGTNWIFLFEAYKHTTIAIATLSYYLAPIIISIISPLLLKEKLTYKKMMLSIISLVGLALVSGAFDGSGIGNGLGILYGIAAAISYASLTLLNKQIIGLNSMIATIAQFGISIIILIPYTLLNTNFQDTTYQWNTWVNLIIIGVFHAGIAFWLFFSAVRDLKAQTIAVLSYLDPITAVLMSSIVLNERLDFIQIIGACIILGSAFMSGIAEEGLNGKRRQVYPNILFRKKLS